MIVVDASVLVESLAGEDGRGARLDGEELHAPHLLDAEVAHVLRKRHRLGLVDVLIAAGALADLTQLAITRHAHVPLLDRVWELRDNLTAYDALYVALAERLGAPLVTADARIAACPGLRTSVEVVAAG